jgi:molybdenum-dependent DNA-binding transcriptional regulator ModE
LPPSEKTVKKIKYTPTKHHNDIRLERILENTVDPRVRKTIKAVLEGENLVTACKKTKISYANFKRIAKNAENQLSLRLPR